MRSLIAVFCIISSPALATDLAVWEESGKWTIYVDPAVGNGCFAQRTFDDGTQVQIGAEPARDGGFFGAYNAEWTDIEIGATGILKFDFGDAKFAGDVVGRLSGDLPGGYAFFDNPEFVKEFGKRNTVIVTGEAGRHVEVDLSGTKVAIDTILKCQDEQPEVASE